MGGEAVAALAVAILAFGGAVSVSAPTAVHPLEIAKGGTMTDSIFVAATADYEFQPDAFQQVPTAANITVTFRDNDTANMPHSFNISKDEGFQIPADYTPTQLNQFFTTYGTMFSLMVNYTGDQATGWFQSPATPGWYEFVCNVSGHFELGMYGFIAFGENLPRNLTRQVPVGIGLGSISPLDAALIGAPLVAALVGLAVWRLRVSAPKRPPGGGSRGRTSDGPRQGA
jgi:plastocyanin